MTWVSSFLLSATSQCEETSALPRFNTLVLLVILLPPRYREHFTFDQHFTSRRLLVCVLGFSRRITCQVRACPTSLRFLIFLLPYTNALRPHQANRSRHQGNQKQIFLLFLLLLVVLSISTIVCNGSVHSVTTQDTLWGTHTQHIGTLIFVLDWCVFMLVV